MSTSETQDEARGFAAPLGVVGTTILSFVSTLLGWTIFVYDCAMNLGTVIKVAILNALVTSRARGNRPAARRSSVTLGRRSGPRTGRHAGRHRRLD